MPPDHPASDPLSPHPPGSFRELAHVAVPLILSSGSLSVTNVVDRIFLARFDPDALAAATPAGMLHWTVMSLFLGVALTVNTFVAQYGGAGKPGRAAASVWQGVYVSLAAGLGFAAFVPFAPALFELTGHPPRVRGYEVEYVRVLCYGAVPMVAGFALSGWFSGRGRTRTVMGVNFALAAVNIVLDRVLIFGLGPVPACGVGGAAGATVIAFTVACGLYLALAGGGSREARRRFWSAWRPDGALLGRLLRYGLPTGLHLFADLLAITAFLLLLGRLGSAELQATNIAFNLNTLCFLPVIGLGTAVTTIVGRRVGEGDPDAAAVSVWRAFAAGGAWMLAFAALFTLLPDPLIDPYLGSAGGGRGGDADGVRAATVVLLRFIAVFSLFDAMAVLFGSAVRGAGDTTFPMLWTVATAWLLMVLPTAWVVFGRGGESPGDLNAAWLGCTAYIAACGLGLMARFAGGRWRTMSVLGADADLLE